MPSPSKFAHVVYRTRQIEAMRAWYLAVLEAEVSFENRHMAFLTYDDEHHRVAIMSDRRATDPVDRAFGVDHVAFAYDSLEELLDTHDRLAAVGIDPIWAVNHGPTTSLYYRDPDGNKVELQIENFDTLEEANQFFRSEAFASNPIGVEIDVEVIRKGLESGEPREVLLARPQGPMASPPQ